MAPDTGPSGAEPALAMRGAPPAARDAPLLPEEVAVNDELLELWEFPRGFDLGKITDVAQDRLTPPDLRAQLVSSRGDVLTAQIAEGRVTEDSDFLVYVRGRGAFEMLRREVWPGGRALVTLRAWPNR